MDFISNTKITTGSVRLMQIEPKASMKDMVNLEASDDVDMTGLVSPGTFVLPAEELTEKRLQRRQKQIDIGKMSEGYQNYMKKVPKEARIPNEIKHPRTPDPRQSISKRAFEKQVRNWRNLLHLWDDPDVDPLKDMAKLTLDDNNETLQGTEHGDTGNAQLSNQDSDGINMQVDGLKKMISTSIMGTVDMWCLDAQNDNILKNRSQSLLGMHVYHEDKRPGTKLVLYANDCASNGKQWELSPCHMNGQFQQALKGEYVYIRSKLNGFVVTLMEQDTMRMRKSNQQSSINIKTLNHSYIVALMPMGKTNEERHWQTWRRVVVEVRRVFYIIKL